MDFTILTEDYSDEDKARELFEELRWLMVRFAFIVEVIGHISWSVGSRGFHYINNKHLDRYVNKFVFRWDRRKMDDISRILVALHQTKAND